MRSMGLLLAAGLPLAAGGGAFAQTSPEGTTPDEIRAMVAEMLADAESRSSLLRGGGSAGHDGGFFLASPDGDFRMNISGQIQFRYILNIRDEDAGADPFDPADDNDEFESGFEATRTALRFDGHVIDPSILYAVQFNAARDGGAFELEDAYFGKVFDNGLILLAGQLREPILWEDVLHEKYSLAVDQSVVNAVFRSDRAQGVWLHKQEEQWRFWAGVNSGIRSENTTFVTQPVDFGATTRWEWKFDGDWTQFDKFSFEPGSAFAAKLGGGAHYELAKHTAVGDSDNELFAYTADLMLGGDGWGAYIAGVGLFTDIDGGGAGGTFNDYGVVAQGSMFLSEDWEAFLRYDGVFADSDRANDDEFNTLTLGANYYIHGQAAKFTVDVQWFFDEVAGNDLVSATAATDRGEQIGLLQSFEENQFAIRAQLQLLF